ncbi:NEDD8 ultimate buster 1 [Teleopsis dalmanni]|uniref:NEDD8 ultimate buster 1 n=1 Tax=Teleopsis dalmanni TaxID=139649 RepID=UPI0018CE3E6D|nr:NEDD8 ultimate buster 1 [Teleopsis dalmanni]XP_037937515.1 NEDD8 ultimate buster 1 [Teleopsis dalmanni]
MSQITNVITLVRARLRQLNIKLWEEPYYLAEVGPIVSEVDRLAEEFSRSLSITVSQCVMALNELQAGALDKLNARREYEQTGLATLKVRRVSSDIGTQNMFDIKVNLNVMGSELQTLIAAQLNLTAGCQVKCIHKGKIVDQNKTLQAQMVTNNENILVIVSEVEPQSSGNADAIYSRVQRIKMDVEKIVDSKRQLFEMEDQDGNTVFLPPEENRAILMAMSFYEKARAALKRDHFDEALVLLLEADEKFLTCNSKFLEVVDNYALVNLDIVWCYLLLKNVTQLPDAERRLKVCESSFNRSYGENMSRLIALKGNACPERALLMRLHLLQGVVLFHQNRRDEAYYKFEVASKELIELKVDDAALATMVEMGYEPFEARLGLRASGGLIDQAINSIQERREKLLEARKRNAKERKVNDVISRYRNKEWINPRSVSALMDMGYTASIASEALKRSKNDLVGALELLQTQGDELRSSVSAPTSVNNLLLDELKKLGFDEQLANIALQTTGNNIDKAADYLIRMLNDENQLKSMMEKVSQALNAADGPSTSSGINSLASDLIQKAQLELESLTAYRRFHVDITDTENDYLDLPLLQEEQILTEYRNLLT